MSIDRPKTPPTTLLHATSNQYAVYQDSPTTARDHNTMPSPESRRSTPSKLQVFALLIPKAWENPLAGAGAGFMSGIVTCPLDVIKTKLQAQGGFRPKRTGISDTKKVYHGMIGSARTIVKEDGIRGLYRGLGPMLLGYLPTWAVYMTIYERSREPYMQMCDNWWLARMYSSLTAGACSTLLTNPIWVIKTRLMSQSSRGTSDGMRVGFYYRNTWDAAKKMYQAEGFRSFYSGLTPAMLGLTHVAVQFPLYEFFKMQFTGYGIGEHPGEDAHSNWLGITAATFLSKTCASTATYPHEVLRTRLQTQQRKFTVGTSDGMGGKEVAHRSFLQMCRMIVKEEGWRAFYAGLGTNLIRAVPSAMTTMLTYEWLSRTIRDLKTEGEKIAQDKDAYTV